MRLKLRKSGSAYCQGFFAAVGSFFLRNSIRTGCGAILFVENRGLLSQGKTVETGK